MSWRHFFGQKWKKSKFFQIGMARKVVKLDFRIFGPPKHTQPLQSNKPCSLARKNSSSWCHTSPEGLYSKSTIKLTILSQKQKNGAEDKWSQFLLGQTNPTFIYLHYRLAGIRKCKPILCAKFNIHNVAIKISKKNVGENKFFNSGFNTVLIFN